MTIDQIGTPPTDFVGIGDGGREQVGECPEGQDCPDRIHSGIDLCRLEEEIHGVVELPADHGYTSTAIEALRPERGRGWRPIEWLGRIEGAKRFLEPPTLVFTHPEMMEGPDLGVQINVVVTQSVLQKFRRCFPPLHSRIEQAEAHERLTAATGYRYLRDHPMGIAQQDMTDGGLVQQTLLSRNFHDGAEQLGVLAGSVLTCRYLPLLHPFHHDRGPGQLGQSHTGFMAMVMGLGEIDLGEG